MKSNLIECFKTTIATDPGLASWRARQKFITAATVEIFTDDMRIVNRANEYAGSWAMTKLVRRKADSIGGRRWWEFEDEKDAILFHMKMTGKLI